MAKAKWSRPKAVSVVNQKTSTGVFQFTFFGDGKVKVEKLNKQNKWGFINEVTDKAQIKKMIKSLENPKKGQTVSYKEPNKKIPKDFLTYETKAGTASSASAKDDGNNKDNVASKADKNEVTTQTSTAQTPKGNKQDQVKDAFTETKKPMSEAAKLGTMFGGLAIGGAFVDWAVQSTGPAAKYSKERIKFLEGQQARGRLGRDPGLEAQTYRTMTQPVMEYAAEARRRTEAGAAGMGESRRPADLARARTREQMVVAENQARAGQAVGQIRAQNEQKARAELESQYAYQQQVRENRANKAMQGLTMAAAQLGQMYGAQATSKPMSPLEFLEQAREVDPDITKKDALKMWHKLQIGTAGKEATENQLKLAEFQRKQSQKLYTGG